MEGGGKGGVVGGGGLSPLWGPDPRPPDPTGRHGGGISSCNGSQSWGREGGVWGVWDRRKCPCLSMSPACPCLFGREGVVVKCQMGKVGWQGDRRYR